MGTRIPKKHSETRISGSPSVRDLGQLVRVFGHGDH